MKIIELKSTRSKVKGFPYALIKWQKEFRDIEQVISQFIKHKAPGVIVHCAEGWCVFTDGKLRIENTQRHADQERKSYKRFAPEGGENGV